MIRESKKSRSRNRVLFLLPLLFFSCFEERGEAVEKAAQAIPAQEQPSIEKRVFTLEEAVVYGLKNNPQIKAAQYALEGAVAGEKSARSNFFPQLDATYGIRALKNESSNELDRDYLDQNTDSGRVRLSQPLFLGFSALNTYQRAGVERELNAARLEQARLAIILEIQSRFLEYIKARENQRSVKSGVERLKTQLDAVEAGQKLGLSPWLMVLQFRSELASAERSQVEADSIERTSKTRLNGLLDLPPLADVEYKGSSGEGALKAFLSLDVCRRRALENRPDILAARKNIALAEKDLKLVQSRFYPRLSLDGDFNYQNVNYDKEKLDDYERSYWSLGLNAQIPLFSGGRNYYERERVIEEISRAKALLKDLENAIDTEVTAEFMALEDNGERIMAAQKELESAKETYEMAEARSRNDLGTNLEIIDAQAMVTRSEVSLNQAMTDQRLALARLFSAMGMFQYRIDQASLDALLPSGNAPQASGKRALKGDK